MASILVVSHIVYGGNALAPPERQREKLIGGALSTSLEPVAQANSSAHSLNTPQVQDGQDVFPSHACLAY